MSYHNSFRLTPEELLEIQVRTLQDTVPDAVTYRSKTTPLTRKEKLAAGRAIWYILHRGWGRTSAVSKASGSFGCSPAKVERALEPVFPTNYFTALENNKNRQMQEKIDSTLDK